jgi:hypothetical protein
VSAAGSRERLKVQNEAAVQQKAAAEAIVVTLGKQEQAIARARLEELHAYLLRLPKAARFITWIRQSNPR